MNHDKWKGFEKVEPSDKHRFQVAGGKASKRAAWERLDGSRAESSLLQQEGSTWKVEASLADAKDGTRADPVIVRDGDKGRLIPCVQINGPKEPLAEIGTEIITWLYKTDTPVEPASKLSVTWGSLKTR